MYNCHWHRYRCSIAEKALKEVQLMSSLSFTFLLCLSKSEAWRYDFLEDAITAFKASDRKLRLRRLIGANDTSESHAVTPIESSRN